MNSIINWNMQSYKTKFNDLKLLIKEQTPACICLQETLLRDNPAYPPSRYNIVQSAKTRDDDHERSVAILTHSSIAYDQVPINSNLQIIAIKIHLKRTYTICTIYLPHLPISYNDIENIIDQLPRPFLLLGDFNAKSPIWGHPNTATDARGDIIERIILNKNVSILNNGAPTHYHVQTNSYSSIDLAICSSDILLDYQFNTIEDLHGSDHFPILLSPTEPEPPRDLPERFNINKADWNSFKNLTSTEMIIPQNGNIDEIVDMIETTITTAARNSIPIKGISNQIPVPWFNNDCKNAKRQRLRAQRAYRRNNTVYNKISFSMWRARCRRTFEEARKTCWREYLSGINQNTKLSTIWKKVAKISGKFRRPPTPILTLNDGTQINDKKDVANELASTFASATSDENYTQTFLPHKRNIERNETNFTTRRQINYNEKFTMKEFTSCLKQTTDTSPGTDKITYSMIKHLHPTMTEVIIKLFNLIYCNQIFPRQWRTAIIIAIPKPNKDHRNSTNYRPISLTNCLCKLMEKMVNHRLMWILEKRKPHIDSTIWIPTQPEHHGPHLRY